MDTHKVRSSPRQTYIALLAAVVMFGTVVGAITSPEAAAAPTSVPTVLATVETKPVPHSGDAADDMAVWVHQTDTSLSTVIGTDKQGGLAVYGLDGSQVQYLPAGNMNNVDIRYNFPL